MASAKADYYELLEVSRTSDGDAIKRSYRKLAMKYHPDKNPGDKQAEARFREISEAYEVLSDAQKRAAYDRFGHSAFEQGGFGGAGAAGFDMGGLSDILNEVFGEFMGAAGGRGPGAGGGAARGRDARYDLEISLEEAFRGAEKHINVTSPLACEPCKGTGAKPGTSATACKQCNGHGKMRIQQGFFLMERTCPVCMGEGRVIEQACEACHGQGRVRRERTLKVSIPRGVDNGTRIRLSGEGEAGARGGPAGDLYVFIGVKPHPFFQREESSLLTRVPVSIALAALGGTLEVPTIDGAQASVALPEGTQNGQQFRLKGQGMVALQTASRRGDPIRGDLFVEISVETPVNLSKRQKELLKEFEAAGDAKKNSPQSQGFFDKVKSFFEGVVS